MEPRERLADHRKRVQGLPLVAEDVADVPARTGREGAWPVKLVAGARDSESNENVIEPVTLAYDVFELVQ